MGSGCTVKPSARECPWRQRCHGGSVGSTVVDTMAVDKKVVGGRVRLVLLERIGKAVLTDDFDPEVLLATLNEGADKGQFATA